MAKLPIMRLTSTTLVAGLVAGAVLAAIDLAVYGVVLKAPMAEAMLALPKPRMPGLLVPWYISMDLLAGFALMWLYGAMGARGPHGHGLPDGPCAVAPRRDDRREVLPERSADWLVASAPRRAVSELYSVPSCTSIMVCARMGPAS